MQDFEKENINELIKSFVPHGKVHSPLFGSHEAATFYKKIFTELKPINLTIKNIFKDENNPNIYAVYLTSSWKLKTGKIGNMEGVNIYEFPPESALIQSVKFIYDTSSIRQEMEK